MTATALAVAIGSTWKLRPTAKLQRPIWATVYRVVDGVAHCRVTRRQVNWQMCHYQSYTIPLAVLLEGERQT